MVMSYAYGLTSVNNSCKKAIRPAVFYSNMNPRDKYHNVDNSINIMNIHYSWYSQQHSTQSYNENILI